MSKREWSTSDQIQRHGDGSSKKRSGHLIADIGKHREVICTIRFSNSDSNGPEVFEAAVNNDDLKPPARHTVLPPPMPSLDDAEEEEEAEEEEVITVNHPVNPIQTMRRRA